VFWLILSFVVFLAAMCVVGYGIVRNLPQRRRNAVVHLLGASLFFGGILNFLVYWHVAVYIGGDAVSGKIENDRHFVSSHGKLTQVSKATWLYSYGHKVSTWITHALVLVGWLLMYLTDPERNKLTNKSPQPTPPDDSLPNLRH
jgi:hypothetical protein